MVTMEATAHDVVNPLAGLISDDTYLMLEEHHVFNEKAIRDYHIRTTFRNLRDQNIPAFTALERLRKQHPHLQYDTIRKIVYK